MAAARPGSRVAAPGSGAAGTGAAGTVVAPYVDAAIQMVSDASGGLVTVGPKIELASCSWWAGGTDLTGAGNTGAGRLLATYTRVTEGGRGGKRLKENIVWVH